MNRLLKSFGYAFQGLRTAFAGQANFRIHVAVALLVISLGFIYSVTSDEWMMIVGCIGVVLMAELMNTALEFMVDLVSPQHQPLAGKIKDVAAAAVVVVVIAAVIIGFLIFWKYLLPS
jgi:diacylglycerol kinase